MLFHFGYRLICTARKADLEDADVLFKLFLQGYKNIFGPERITFILHSLLHAIDCCKRFGSVDNFSTYAFENYMQELIKTIRKNGQDLVQVSKRAEEISKLQEMIGNFQNKSGVFNQKKADSNMFNSCKFDEFTVINNVADSCVCLKVYNQKIPFVISGFSKEGNRTFVYGNGFKQL